MLVSSITSVLPTRDIIASPRGAQFSLPVRESSHKLDTERRRTLAKKRLSDALVDGEDFAGVLRRKRLRSNATKKRYLQLKNLFDKETSLPMGVLPPVVDAALNAKLVCLYLTGESCMQTRDTYYAVRWDRSLNNSLLRTSYASMRGHLTMEPSRLQDPETWEGTL